MSGNDDWQNSPEAIRKRVESERRAKELRKRRAEEARQAAAYRAAFEQRQKGVQDRVRALEARKRQANIDNRTEAAKQIAAELERVRKEGRKNIASYHSGHGKHQKNKANSTRASDSYAFIGMMCTLARCALAVRNSSE